MQPLPVDLDLAGVVGLHDHETRNATTLRLLNEQGLVPVASSVVGETIVVRAEASDSPAQVMVFDRLAPWTPAAVHALVQHLYLVPGDDELEQFTFVGVSPPFTLRYMFSDAWWSVLEARLYAGFSSSDLPLDQVEPYVAHANAILQEFGASPLDVVQSLTTLITALPRPDDGTEYRPVATLLAAGLLLGEEIRRRHPSLTWLAGDDAQARYFALGQDGEVKLRPIDFALLMYSADLPGGIEGYLELVEVRLGD